MRVPVHASATIFEYRGSQADGLIAAVLQDFYKFRVRSDWSFKPGSCRCNHLSAVRVTSTNAWHIQSGSQDLGSSVLYLISLAIDYFYTVQFLQDGQPIQVDI